MLGLFYRTIRTVVRPTPRRSTALAIVAVFSGLGLMPFLLVMNRPELTIQLGVAALVLGAVVVRRAPPRWLRSEGVRLVCYLLLIVVLLGAHPKTLVFAPLFVVTGALWLRGWAPRMVALAVLLATAAQTHVFASERYACPNDAWTAGKLAEVAVPVSAAWRAPAAFVRQARENLFATPRYFGHLGFKGNYMAGWLPDHARLARLDDVGDGCVYAAIGLLGLGVAAAFAHALWVLARERRLDPARGLALVLVSSLAAQIALQGHKNAYDGALLITLGGLGLVLGWPPDAARRFRRPLQAVFVFLVLTTLLSEGRLLYHFGPWATGKWLAGGNLPGEIEGTISGFRYARVNAEVRAAAERCGIDVAQRPKFVLVDDLTYPALAGATYPLHTMGVSWWGVGIPDQFEFLRAFGSEGVVVRCRSVTPELQARARRSGELCCLPTFAGASARPARR
jgi:hypothetical protein